VSAPGRFIPALRFPFLTGFYDGVVRATVRERTFRALLVEQLAVEPGQRVLDLGCGTGTLALLVEEKGARVVGLDADAQVLALARGKARREGRELRLVRAFATAAPFAAGSFDRVVSSLVFHHLTTDEKRAALGQARRLLAPGGELHVADWGEARSVAQRLAFLPVQLLDGFETTADNVRGRLLPLMQEQGFEVTETRRLATLFGTLSLYRGTSPAR
jgi:ubiquinone/menaquinone biosynthesis C-methylase UbiE